MSASRRTVTGAIFLLAGGSFIQLSSALIQPAFDLMGPSAASAWRVLLGGLLLLTLTRPAIRTWSRQQWLHALALGFSASLMNQCFYQSIARLPLGTAVAIEYIGPFLVAAFGKRSWRHMSFVVLAGAGVLFLTRPGAGLSAAGIAFGLGSGACWAAYMFASARVGSSSAGFGGLAVSMCLGALLWLPWSLGKWSVVAAHPAVVGRIAVVAVLAIILGFGAEMQALRRLSPSVAGVLMSAEPAIGFAAGFLVLGQQMGIWDGLGLLAIVIAGTGVTYDSMGELEIPQ